MIHFKKNNVINTLAFIISPLFTIPIIFYSIYKKNNYSLSLIVVFIGLLSFLYVPSVTNDRVDYYNMFFQFKDYSLKNFIFYLGLIKRPDFIFHFLIFQFSKAGIDIQFLFFIVTSFTVGGSFFIFDKLSAKEKLSRIYYFTGFLLFLFSFSYPHLISGMRQYLGMSFLLLAINDLLFEKKNFRGIVLASVAILTHFSLIIFIPALILLSSFHELNITYRVIFLFSFLFFLIPENLIVDFIMSLNLPEGYNAKIEAYLTGEDFIEQGINRGSSNYLLVYLFSIGWIYPAYIYLIYTIKRKSLIRNYNYLFFSFVNMFYTIPTIFWRYSFFLRIIFVLLIIYELKFHKIKPVYIFLCIFFISLLSQIIITRYNLFESYLNEYLISGFLVFLKDIQPHDFLQ